MSPGTKDRTIGKQGGLTGGTSSPLSDWKIYKHATSLSLRYPGDWDFSVRSPPGAVLTPPDQATNAQGPGEAYQFLSEGANSVTSVDDPRVIPCLEAQLAQFAPFLRRTGQPEPININNTPGIALNWSGQNPVRLDVRAFMRATILKGYAIALLGLGEHTVIDTRETIVRTIFSSLTAEAGEHDALLVGTWKFWSYKGSADGRSGSETSHQFRLQGDGICFWSSSRERSGNFSGRDTLDNTTWAGGIASQNGNGVSCGQRPAGNGEPNVNWGDGTPSRWTHQFHTGNSPLAPRQSNQTSGSRRKLLSSASCWQPHTQILQACQHDAKEHDQRRRFETSRAVTREAIAARK